MTAQSHKEVADRAEFCQEAAFDGSVTLLCWLTPGHDGDHWDKIDKVHWHTRDGLDITPCEHKALTP